jgi:hypothetical protein
MSDDILDVTSKGAGGVLPAHKKSQDKTQAANAAKKEKDVEPARKDTVSISSTSSEALKVHKWVDDLIAMPDRNLLAVKERMSKGSLKNSHEVTQTVIDRLMDDLIKEKNN